MGRPAYFTGILNYGVINKVWFCSKSVQLIMGQWSMAKYKPKDLLICKSNLSLTK